jgi:ABC-2 type transport system permease protein
MSFRRIWSVFLRYFYTFFKLDQMSELFYWPAIDIVIWGMTTLWIQQQGGGVPHIALAVLTAIVFWDIVWRGNYEVSLNMLLEFYNRNLVNLFSTPLKIGEWICGVMMVGLFKISVSLAFGSVLVYILYALNVYTIGWLFLPYALCLVLSGWVIGFMTCGLIVYYGQRFQALAWISAYFFTPFSAVYYPVYALPEWGQAIAWCLPTTYIFEGMRQVLYTNSFSMSLFGTAVALSLLYLFFAILFFWWMFEKSREKGLARLE